MARDNFGSKFGAVMALAGSAVGLGNIWKFSYEVGSNGGGAFLLVYILSVVFIGLPVMLSEFIIGRRGQKNAFGSFKALAPNTKWYYFGGLSIVAAALILSFYGTVSGWTLEYVMLAINNSFQNQTTTDINLLFSDFVAHPYKPILWQIGFMILTGVIIMSGVKKGIERYTKLMMPILFIIVIAMGIRACTLPGAAAGLKYLFYPDFSRLTVHGVLIALGQSFFSLSIGMGVLLTYASYVSKKENMTQISMQVVISDTLVAVLAGIAILPAVFAFNVDPSSGPNLVYITLPQVFQEMPLGYVWGILFFILLTFAALTSAMSLLEVCVAYLTEERKMKRCVATTLSTVIISVLGILCTLSFGPMKDVTLFDKTIFDLFDYVSSNIILPLGGILVCVFVGWRMKASDILDEISNSGKLKVKMFYVYLLIIRYVAPIAIFCIFLSSMGLF